VLLKDDVGKARPTYYDLPHAGHAYGRSEPADVEGAREVTMHWAAHVPRPRVGPECQDFRKLNRSAAKCGVRNARDLADYRKTNEFKLTPPGPAGVLPKVIPSDVIPSFSYGQKSRPSTPISHVVGNQYATEHEEALDVQYRLLEERQKMQNKTIIKLTKASKANIADARVRRRDLEEPPEPKEPFKLTKFKKVTSKVGYPAAIRKSSSMPTLQRLPPEVPLEAMLPATTSAAELDLAEE